MRAFRAKAVWALLALLSPVAFAQRTPSIVQIGGGVTGVSADGSTLAVIAESVDFNGFIEMSRWTGPGGLQLLGLGAAFDISRDGNTLVGSRFNGVQERAVRWTAGGGIVELGQLPGAGSNAYSAAYDVSADGSVIVGQADTNTPFGLPILGFRWTSATGMQALNDLPGGNVLAQASAISADGQVTVGYAEGTNGVRAVRWMGSSATPQDMGLPQGLTGFTEARRVSGDGQVVVGVWGNGFENEAFRWTVSGGYELLGDFPGGLRDSVATATNADGSVIVGTGNPGDDVPDEPFYWTRDRGLLPFSDVLTEAGIDFSAWDRFVELRDLSDDGLVIGGTGVLLDGTFAGFRAVIPAPSSLALLAMSGLLATRRHR
jgi:uncharacterized membrane protein